LSQKSAPFPIRSTGRPRHEYPECPPSPAVTLAPLSPNPTPPRISPLFLIAFPHAFSPRTRLRASQGLSAVRRVLSPVFSPRTPPRGLTDRLAGGQVLSHAFSPRTRLKASQGLSAVRQVLSPNLWPQNASQGLPDRLAGTWRLPTPLAPERVSEPPRGSLRSGGYFHQSLAPERLPGASQTVWRAASETKAIYPRARVRARTRTGDGVLPGAAIGATDQGTLSPRGEDFIDRRRDFLARGGKFWELCRVGRFFSWVRLTIPDYVVFFILTNNNYLFFLR
jgi:hypothetical protein